MASVLGAQITWKLLPQEEKWKKSRPNLSCKPAVWSDTVLSTRLHVLTVRTSSTPLSHLHFITKRFHSCLEKLVFLLILFHSVSSVSRSISFVPLNPASSHLFSAFSCISNVLVTFINRLCLLYTKMGGRSKLYVPLITKRYLLNRYRIFQSFLLKKFIY